MRIFNETILQLTDAGAGDYYSDAIRLDHIYGYSVQAYWTGHAFHGSISLEASNDGANWVTVADDLGSSLVDLESTVAYMWNVYEVFYQQYRVHVNTTGGVLSLTAIMNAKGF